jgi:hypothetical protein
MSPLAWYLCGWLSSSAFSLAAVLLMRVRHPRGGYLPPTAYTATNRQTGTSADISAVAFSSSTRPGGAWEVPGGPLTQDETSSLHAPTVYGNGTDGAHGRTVPEPAACDD